MSKGRCLVGSWYLRVKLGRAAGRETWAVCPGSRLGLLGRWWDAQGEDPGHPGEERSWEVSRRRRETMRQGCHHSGRAECLRKEVTFSYAACCWVEGQEEH